MPLDEAGNIRLASSLAVEPLMSFSRFRGMQRWTKQLLPTMFLFIFIIPMVLYLLRPIFAI